MSDDKMMKLLYQIVKQPELLACFSNPEIVQLLSSPEHVERIKKFEIIKNEKEKFSTRNLINTGKVPHELLIIDLLPKNTSPNDILILISLLSELDKVNELLLSSYELFDWLKSMQHLDINQTYEISTLRFNSITIIHFLKHYIDMALIILIRFKLKKSNWHKFDGIGRWLEKKQEIPELSALWPMEEYFKLINNFDNSNKHHVLDLETTRFIGQEELCFFSIDEKSEKPNVVSANYIVNGFNDFLKIFYRLYEEFNDDGQKM